MDFLETYLKAIESISPQDKEHTYRTALENLVNVLKDTLTQNEYGLKDLSIRQEPNNDKEGRGAPDFVILSQGLSIGYIENKRVNADLDSVAQSGQIKKYLCLSDNLMLTNYLRFSLVRKDEKGKVQIAQELRICELSQIKATLKNKLLLESKAKELLELFVLFLTHSPKPINTALEFANALALRTQILKTALIENSDNAHIASLYETFKNQLYKELDFGDFADSFAQTLTYSLFLARLNHTDSKELDLYNAKKFIPKSFPLIRAMSDFLNQLEDLDSIQWLLEEIIHIINHIDIASIIKELNKTSEKDLIGTYTTAYTHKDPYLHFYETFLSQYDPRLREIRGVYYTPASVVSFIINAIDSVLRADFGLQKGLGASLENNHITLLDFATGTGTFLLESFRKALEPMSQNSPKFNPKALLHKFFGFEFLIAPYIIAHLRLSQSFKEEFDAPIEDNERLGIYLTNTLYSKDIKQEQSEKANLFSGIPELVEEAIAAQKTKEKEILIITGNPPYSGASANKGLFELEVQNTYKKPLEIPNSPVAFIKNGKVEKEKNPKWLLDDYVKFICFAESKIQKQGSGIFAFISNNSFLDNPTFRGMRYSLLKTFDKLYILDLHGNARKKELCPDGSKDENVFDIMQGVNINVFIKSLKSNNGDATLVAQPLAQVYHYDLYGKRKDKYNFLCANALDSISWNALTPKAPFYLFIPQNESLREEYDKGWSVKDIFRISSVGVVTGKDSVLIASDEKKLESQVREYYNEFNIEFIKDIAYRPFDAMKIYYDTAKVTRPRSEVMRHFLDNDNQALLVSRQSGVVGDDKINTIAISDKMVDLNFYRRGGEEVMPLYLKNEDLESHRVENFTLEFREFIDSKYNEHFSPEAILGYIYAVLFHKDYREKYIDFLKIDFPKIPFVESKEKFLALSALGQELIAVHLMQDSLIRERERERENRI